MRNSLVTFANELNAIGESWLLGGRTSAALHGAIIHGNSLCFMTTGTACDTLGNRMESFRTQKVKQRDLSPWKGLIGTFRHESIDATVIGDPEFSVGNRNASIPVEDIYLSIDPFEVSLARVWLMPKDWIAFTGFLEGDSELVAAMIRSGVTREAIRSITDSLGLSYVLKSDIDALF